MADQGKVTFMTIKAFKEELNVTSIQVLKNPKTSKLFMSADGTTFRVQQDIDSKKDMRMLIPEEGINEACLVNVSGGAQEQFSL